MKTSKFILLLFSISLLLCNGIDEKIKPTITKSDFVIAFGSCNKQFKENLLWAEIIKNNPQVWIWGGDNIYSSPYKKNKMQKDYKKQLSIKGYQDLKEQAEIIGIWDDHDYGLNDGGSEFSKKEEAQSMFLDFFDVPKDHPRRNQEGIYYSKVYQTDEGSIKVILLDTRYFRSGLEKSIKKNRRYKRNFKEGATVLGDKQWKWLTSELKNSTSDFNIIVSSIQYLSKEHGYEAWDNFPNEVDKLSNVIVNSKAKGVLLLSGDRHISEFSKTKLEGLNYPLIDFTSSGLTHSYDRFTKEPNQYRVKEVVSDISFGLLLFDFKTRKITMQMRGRNNILQQEYIQHYP
ncbi:MAG: alkaline phosphatase family protein [Flavobacteriaceae bacterium]